MKTMVWSYEPYLVKTRNTQGDTGDTQGEKGTPTRGPAVRGIPLRGPRDLVRWSSVWKTYEINSDGPAGHRIPTRPSVRRSGARQTWRTPGGSGDAFARMTAAPQVLHTCMMVFVTWAKSCSKSSAYRSMSTPSAIFVMLFGRGTRDREPRRQHERTHTRTHRSVYVLRGGGAAARWFSLFTRDDAVGWPAMGDGGRQCVQCVRAGENEIIRHYTKKIRRENINSFEYWPGRAALRHGTDEPTTPIDIKPRLFKRSVGIQNDNNQWNELRFRISLDDCYTYLLVKCKIIK